MRILAAVLLCAALAAACSKWDALRAAHIAASRDPVAAAEAVARDKALGYALNPKAALADLKRFRETLAAFTKAVESVWGKKETKEPSPKEYVKYIQNYKSRALVDFDRGLVTVETVDQKRPLESLKNAIVTALLTPFDPRAVDLYSARPVPLGDTPFLLGQVKDFEGQDIRYAWRAERFAERLLAESLQTRAAAGEAAPTVRFVTIPMVRDHLTLRAARYRELVEAQAARFKVSKNLVYAIMKVESDFNPYAINAVPAVGLMQVVPQSAGQEVHQFLRGEPGTPGRALLFNPAGNIEYGTAYLHLLTYRHLAAVANPVSREYCVIAAYNGGPGAVLRTFERDQRLAPERINRLGPLQVYDTLRQGLPSAETRRYLWKVLEAKKEFVNF
jgi:membrane-bound lytic murein transglycosylase C